MLDKIVKHFHIQILRQPTLSENFKTQAKIRHVPQNRMKSRISKIKDYFKGAQTFSRFRLRLAVNFQVGLGLAPNLEVGLGNVLNPTGN